VFSLAKYLNETGLQRALSGLWSKITSALAGKQPIGDYATNGRVNTVEQAIPTTPGAIGAQPAGNYASADDVIDIQELIPTNASIINLLATIGFVNSSIENMSANRVRYDISSNDFPTKAALNSAIATSTFFYQSEPYTPKKNDYAGVMSDEGYGSAPTRYIFDGVVWGIQSVINNTAFTQAQMDAINSGVTALMLAALQTTAGKAVLNDVLTSALTALSQDTTSSVYRAKNDLTQKNSATGAASTAATFYTPNCTNTDGDFRMRNIRVAHINIQA
jgi:hypothetical protein